MNKEWSPESVDDLLDILLAAETEPKFHGLCDRIAEKENRGDRRDYKGRVNGELVQRFLWGLAVRYRGKSYEQKEPRLYRQGPWTWAEEQVVKWAMTTKSKEAELPSLGYLTKLVNRPVTETSQKMQKFSPGRGRKGFGFAEL